MPTRRAPSYSWRRLDGETWAKASPLVGLGVLAVSLSFGVWGGAGFGYALGVGGLLLGAWAIFIAVWTTEDAHELDAAVAEAKATLTDLKTTLTNLKTTAESLAELDRFDRLRRIDEALRLLSGPALKIPQLGPYPTPPDKPLKPREVWPGKRALERAMRFKGGLSLPVCDALVNALNDVVLDLSKYGGRTPPTREEFRKLLEAAKREVQRLLPKM